MEQLVAKDRFFELPKGPLLRQRDRVETPISLRDAVTCERLRRALGDSDSDTCGCTRGMPRQLGHFITIESDSELSTKISGRPTMASTFGEFYQSFRFSEYPFSVYTSENEQSHGKELFVDFSMNSPIIEGFMGGRTMLLAGDRGTGKTAIIYDFCRRALKSDLIVNITDYSDLPLGFDSTLSYKFVISQFSERLFSKMADDRKSGGILSRSDKVLLSYFLAHFVKQSSKGDLHQKLVELQTGWKAWLGRKCYAILRIPLNIGANASVAFLSDIIAQAAGTAKQPPEWKEYFPEYSSNIEEVFSTPEASLAILKKLVTLSNKLGYKKVIFVFDKVDEDARLNNAAEEIESFIETVVTDNRFLTDDSFQVIVLIWVIPFNMLKDRVRTQKIFCPSLSWTNADLICAADRRVSVFSGNAIEKLADIFESGKSTEGFEEMLVLANKNPRDLWHLLDKSFRSQFKLDPSVKKISETAIRQGISDFVCQFNFYEYYPRKSNARANSMDIYAYIRLLLKLQDPEFTRNQLNDRAGTGSSTQNYVAAMENMGLIERSGSTGGSATFKIRAPKVIHALANNLEIARSN